MAVGGGLLATPLGALPTATHRNGRVTFRTVSAREVHTINPDGSGLRTLLRCPPGSRCVFENHAWSPDGTRFAFERGYGFCCLHKGERSNHPLFVVNADGRGAKRVQGCGRPGPECGPFAWAPDSRRIAVFRGTTLYVVDTRSGRASRVGQPPSCCDSGPVWSPDGSAMLFATRTNGGAQLIWRMNADGSGLTKLGGGLDPQWSPDGTRIAFDANNGIDTMDPDGSNVTTLIEEGVAREGTSPAFPFWSPDGKRIAYAKTPDTTPGVPGGFRAEIWTMNADGTGQRLVYRSGVGIGGDALPDWSPDGTIIAFIDPSRLNGIKLVNVDWPPHLRTLAANASSLAWQPLRSDGGT